MLSEPRTISMISELIHVPVVHQPEKLRDIYNELCRTCGYENFLRVQGGAQIERRDTEGQGFSQLRFLGDRIQLTEDHAGITVDQFGQKISAVLSTSLGKLGIPVVLVQQNTVRVTSNPNTFQNAAEYLRSLFRIRQDHLEPLGRPTSVFGFRLVFPPAQGHAETYNVRVESYVRDTKALYVENVGVFKSAVQAANLQVLESNLQKCFDFLDQNVIPFLSLYDRREMG